MPKYLGIDFLAQTLIQKDQLLSRMLLICPRPEETKHIFQKKSQNNKNEKQDFWLRLLDKAHPEKLPNEKLDSCPLNIVSSPIGNKPESFQAKFEVEYVPSSNPDSSAPSFLSDSFTEMENEVIHDVCNYLDRNEIDNTIINLTGSENDSEQPHEVCHPLQNFLERDKELEEMFLMDCFEEFDLWRTPHFLELAARLRPGRVTDPFLDEDGHLRSERRMICYKFDHEVMSKEDKFENPLKEILKKYPLSEQEKDELCNLSPVTDSPYIYHINDLKSNLDDLTELLTEEDEKLAENNDRINELQHLLKCQKWSECQDYETFSKELTEKQFGRFIQLNETGQKQDSVTISTPLLLMSPPPPQNQDVHVLKDNLRIQLLNMKPEKTSCPCSPRFEDKNAKKIDNSSKLFDIISSLILEVPDLKEKYQNQQRTNLSKIPCLVKEDFTSVLELRLRWVSFPKSLRASVPNLQQICYEENMFSTKRTEPLDSPPARMLPWNDIYVSHDDLSTKFFVVVKEKKVNPPLVVSAGPANVAILKDSTDVNKNSSHIHSGIDDFVLLRTGIKSSVSSNYPPKAIVKAMNVQQNCGEKKQNENSKEEKMKHFDEVIEVPLCKELQSVFTLIEKNIRLILLELQEIGFIPSSYVTANLTPDYTRFILKQEEKKKIDGLSTNHSQDTKNYHMLVCLHTLVIAADLLKECGLSVAQDHVKTTSIQYRKTLAGALDNIIHDLSAAEQHLTDMQLVHPKVVKTCEYIRDWLPQSLEDKILVIIFRGFSAISSSLLNQLQHVKGLKTVIIDKKSQNFSVIVEAHVIITDIVIITEHFPWSRFTCVISFEDKHEWLSNILGKKPAEIKHVVCLKGTVSKGQQTPHDCKGKAILQSEEPKRETYTLIGSTKVTSNIQLLICLEKKFDIIIIEREYEKMLKSGLTTLSKMCLQPDLMLDEKAGVIIESIINFSSEKGYKNAVDLVLSTSFKCQMCSIILACDTNGRSAYSFVGDVQSNLAKFHGCLVSIQSSFPHFVIDVFYSHSVTETASLVRRLCEITRDSSDDCSKKDWVERHWLTDEISEHERFLLGFPSLNSFSAQRMLSVMPLDMLLTLSFSLLKKELPWIPDRNLKDFWETANCGWIPEEDEDNSEMFNTEIQVPRFPEEDYTNTEDTSYPVFSDIDNDETIALCDGEYPFSESKKTSHYFRQISPTYSTKNPKFDVESFSGSSIRRPSRDREWKMTSENEIFNSIKDNNWYPDTRENKVQLSGLRHGFHVDRQMQRTPLSPVHGNLGHMIGTVPHNPSNSHYTYEDGKLKSNARSSKSFRGGNEMPDVIGVVQPKPRIEKSTYEKFHSQLPRSAKGPSGVAPQYSEIPNSVNLWQEMRVHEYPEVVSYGLPNHRKSQYNLINQLKAWKGEIISRRNRKITTVTIPNSNNNSNP